MKLGCIADDFTGATDLANNLVRAGMRSVQTIGVPDGPPPAGAEAVVVALKSRTIPAAEAVARSRWRCCAGCASMARSRSTSGLLDLRFHRPRQHRPGHRGADGRAGLRFHDRLPGLPGQRPHRLQGLSLHRRGAAQRGQHARTSADADDRPQPRARDAAPVPAPRRADRARRGAARQRGDRRAHGGAACRRHRHRDRRRAGRRRPARDGPRLRRAAGAHRRLGRGDRPASQLRPRAQRRRGRTAALGRRTGDRLGSCSAASNAQVAAFLAGTPGAASRSTRCAWLPAKTSPLPRWPGLPGCGEEPLLVYATAQPEAVKAVQAALGVEAAGALVERTLARAWPRTWSGVAWRGWWWPAAKPPAPACRRWA